MNPRAPGTGASLISVHAAFANDRGRLFATVFAVALLASRLASASAGVYSGQAIMRGFLRRESNVWLRRLISAVPALLILTLIGSPTRALVLSQVMLAFGLPFALIPLLIFTARRSIMGRFANRARTTALAGCAAFLDEELVRHVGGRRCNAGQSKVEAPVAQPAVLLVDRCARWRREPRQGYGSSSATAVAPRGPRFRVDVGRETPRSVVVGRRRETTCGSDTSCRVRSTRRVS